MTRAFVGLGSNVGDRLNNLRSAVSLIQGSCQVMGRSSVYETDPIGPPQPDFLNAVIEVETDLEAEALLGLLKDVEIAVGRTPTQRWGPREIDLDLLLYGDDVIDGPTLTVPHPRMEERAFVTVPLGELRGEVSGPDVDGVRRVGEL